MALTLLNFLAWPFKWKWTLEDVKGTTEEDTIKHSADDISLWVEDVGSMLQSMLVMAGYPSDSESLHTKFFRESVARSLGSHPKGCGPPDSWKSFMTDDHTPVELSWCWSTSLATPTVRYSVEPIGPSAGQEVDPINTAASQRLLGDALCLTNDLDLYLHRHLQSLLLSRNEPARREHQKSLPPQSQSFMAFDLLEKSIVVKQYYLPAWKALEEEKTKISVIRDAFQKLPAPAKGLLDSIYIFNEFLDSFPDNLRPVAEIVAIDCLDPSQSRLKIYVRSPFTTLKSVIEMLSLGGRAPKTQDELDSLRELWCSVFDLNPAEYLDDQPLSEKEHRTGGILYYFELKRGAKIPKSKAYLPVRHYAKNDEQIARGLSEYLARRGRTLATGSYYDGVKKLCKHRDLADGLGFHTYICWASDQGQWNVTAYFNPEIYYQSEVENVKTDPGSKH
ncbi:hypothetical protein DTO027I6_9085 [Penicillium roqueforti]|uniref:uncharacterized protein n=1 Tax=Penicillium roqueforti TaxID=5082 RepID=UPI00190A1460|nr:uncharacterized protein LCP9604111_8434 [Penicillium roqueforti]KAF9241491.1 hypothetical protein LCP9604111_8434 [Penicillium roqueforti]KAI1830327.1 hypothetical protein CBS147337_8794 [Penicillium roqueforti]KAI3188493.1 hypothetical protein DTO027I6_9085 [Penicillium roqueforti]